jgi:hypothetical protein
MRLRTPRPWSRACLLTVLLLASHVRVAAAACNAIPDVQPFYRGAIGSIDRPFLSPDADERVTLRPACGSPTLAEAKFGAGHDGHVAPQDLVVTIIFKPHGTSTHRLVVAGNDDCEPFQEPVCCLERLFCPPTPTCLPGKDVALEINHTTGIDEVRFHFPDLGFGGPLAVGVSTTGKPLDLTSGCAKIARDGVFACIDSLVPSEAAPCEALALERRAEPDPPPVMQLIALPQSNDYQAVCSHDNGATPRCMPSARSMSYTVEADGTLVLPMEWNKILRLEGGVGIQYDRRRLLASTAVEAFDHVAGHVVIPGETFLQTMSQQGGPFVPAPIFQPTEPPTPRPNELTLTGTADKPKSVLRFFRRMAWQEQCDGGANSGQACEQAADCPNAACAVQESPGYFSCKGGARGGLPCTRPGHCPGGACTPRDFCYTPVVGVTAQSCFTDAECATGQECGRGLFEFRDRVDAKGRGTVDRVAAFGESGVCASGGSEGDACSGPLSCSLGFVSCVRYRAEASAYE